ncbi:MAG: C25 family cysteine peptidase, partial [Niastella sp.]|uniref:putative type IX secretion system sortase PorU2 n=1 Tax=Niastella sp. TaxID=1869183 RepID=UPI00389A6E4F
LPSNGYIEFWGERNDGKPDKALYRDPAYQHTTYYSLQSDTATYFLSVNTSGAGFRYTDMNNNVAGNALPTEPYFMYTKGVYYPGASSNNTLPINSKPNLGLASNVGTDVYSSSYDIGEFFASGNINPATTLTTTASNLNVYSAGPASSIKFGAVGNAANNRNIVMRVNGVTLKDTVMAYYNDLITTAPVDNNSISSGSLTVTFNNTSGNSLDRMQVSFFELTYPRTFDFNGAANFKFELPARAGGYFLQISNFSFGSGQPVLYDTKNGERYTANMNGGIAEFALPGSAANRQLVLVSEDGSNINTVTTMTSRNFINYNNAVNQGTYIIISNPILYAGTSGNNPVQDYKNYRESVAGGGFKVLIVDINDLVDQFAFGINKHPLSVRNFIRFARAKFAKKPEYIFLIGKGVTYYEYQAGDRNPGSYPLNNLLNLVPTFGYPGSDNLLSAEDLTMPVATTPIGRLSVVSGKEIEDYLEKVKEYEQVQKNAPNTVAGREWMKNVVHITGSTDAFLGTVLCNYMDIYRHMIEDTLYGGHVQMFCKGSNNPGNQISPEKLAQYFAEGLSIVNYFGHSSATTLEFNIDDPYNYNNQGKYPVFFVNGCKAGDFFTYTPARLQVIETLSEKFTMAKQRGGIAFVASTHFGIVNYLNLYLSYLYESLGAADYEKSLGLTLRDAFQQLMNGTGSNDFYARMHAEQMTLNGDPAIVINAQLKPDYVIEDQTITITPPFISVAEGHFTVKVKMLNLGKALPDSVVLEVKQQYPNGSMATLYRQKIPGIRYADSVTLEVPIISTRDKGLNKIIATIDADSKVNEISESNNTITKQFFIFENEARPVYPYMYAIINNPTQTLYASTANPLDSLRKYVVEVDTTGLFNSSLKVSKAISATGGVFEINPGITYQDSTVYYWRIAAEPDPGSQYQWLVSSFMYMNGTNTDGFAQAHHFQHLNSTTERMSLDSASRQWKFGTRSNYLFVNTGAWGTSTTQEDEMDVTVNGIQIAHNFCVYNSIVFIVFDPVTFQPWKNNYNPSTGAGQYGSDGNCYTGRDYNFEYPYTDTASRARMRNFMENVIPDGYYVVARTGLRDPVKYPYLPQAYAADWANDTTYYGQYNSIYHSFLKFGLTGIDSFNSASPKNFIFVYKKNDNATYSPVFKFTPGLLKTSLSVDCVTPDTIGYITSPVFGPARKWKEVIWKGVSLENPSTDNPSVQVVGIKNDFTEEVLYTLDKDTRNFDISPIADARIYPNIKLRMRNIDSLHLTPFQLQSWKITYDPVPEGSMAANLFLVNMKDTLALGETAKFGIAFKNVSKTPFDSIKVKAVITDRGNVAHTLFVRKQKPIISGDSIIVQLEFKAKDYPGNNLLFVEANTDNDQREQYLFNNFVYKNFYVVQDNKNPVLDVTFDGVHILNKDIVSAKPHIQIKLTDESSYLLLNDTTLSSVQVRYPDGTLRTYNFDGDTLRFIPATSGSNNTATIEFTPQFTRQINPEGDLYELVVKGKDRSGNKAGDIAYRVGFTVISKPMISNVLNYPNPFSTSTAFVFTITGSEVPQNVRVQILTVTGKIVREITMNELGPLHIGRNITEYKWNGTDQYGDKLANGVYLYRVITSMNGKTMEKYKSKDDNTDKYFNNGYGKMYLMR